MKGKTLFREEQSFVGTWSWYVMLTTLIGSFVFFGWGIYQQLYVGEPWGDTPMSDNLLITLVVIVFLILKGVTYLLYKNKLEVEIDEISISYRFKPYHRTFRHISWQDIKEAQVSTYQPIMEFGGWGVRLSFNKKAYSVQGKWALIVKLKNGKSIYFGTQQPDKMKVAVSRRNVSKT